MLDKEPEAIFEVKSLIYRQYKLLLLIPKVYDSIYCLCIP